MGVDGAQSNGRLLAREQFRVTMADTDAARVIYFGAPTRWAERLVTTWLAEVGCAVSDTLNAGFGSPAVHVELTYRAPLRLDDEVIGTLWLNEWSRRSLTFRCEFSARDQLSPAVELLLTQVQVRTNDDRLTAVALPDRLLVALESGPGLASSRRIYDSRG
jgi:acyl-CoA thioester hydrolase